MFTPVVSANLHIFLYHIINFMYERFPDTEYYYKSSNFRFVELWCRMTWYYNSDRLMFLIIIRVKSKTTSAI